MGAFDFTHALLRRPGLSVSDGLRDGDHDGPSYEGVEREHSAYEAALRELGVKVEVLPPLEEFPDAIFVEDPALTFSEGAILLNPGAPSRAGEVGEISDALGERFERLLTLATGHAEGGDILTTPSEVLIGLSARTDREGATALIELLAELGKHGRIVTTPPGVLHFKTGCGRVHEETVAVTAALDSAEMFGNLRRMVLPEDEEAGANLLRVRDHVLIGEGFPKTREMIERHGVATIALPITEIAKIDAGLSCMSLRWRQE